MISFPCEVCGQRLQANEELAGSETSCGSCGTVSVVPIDLDCEGLPASPDARTITLAELQAIRNSL